MQTVSDFFGCHVFSEAVMKQKLPKAVFKDVYAAIHEGKRLDLAAANVVANSMKDWAIELGATHFTHWFQPMTGVTAEKLLLDSSELAGTAFETTSRGLRVKADTLKTLSTGSHTLTFRLSDGQTATVMVTAARETAAQLAQTAAFDRYYRSTNFKDISVKLEGVNAKSDITKVVLGLTPLSYEFDEASRTLTLRRATLAQLPSGTYTVTVETKSGGSVQAVDLTVSDTTPAGVNALTASYRSAAPAAVRFAVPMQGRSVRSITVAQDGRAYTLNAGTDYFAASDGISLAANVLGRYGVAGACTVYTAALSDHSIWLLAADCI